MKWIKVLIMGEFLTQLAYELDQGLHMYIMYTQVCLIYLVVFYFHESINM